MTNTIIMQNDDLPENADNWTILHRNGNAPQVQFWNLNEGFEIDINDYHAIARVSGPAVKGGHLLYRLTNNVDESWSRDFAGSHDDEYWGAWEMEVADLHTDSNGKNGATAVQCRQTYTSTTTRSKHGLSAESVGRGSERLNWSMESNGPSPTTHDIRSEPSMMVKRFRDAPVPIKWFVALFHSGVRNCARRSGTLGSRMGLLLDLLVPYVNGRVHTCLNRHLLQPAEVQNPHGEDSVGF